VEVLVDQAVKVLFGEVEGVGTDGDTDEASGDVVGLETTVSSMRFAMQKYYVKLRSHPSDGFNPSH
jgi:hypothetical protein